jgi:hypothetical protein
MGEESAVHVTAVDNHGPLLKSAVEIATENKLGANMTLVPSRFEIPRERVL